MSEGVIGARPYGGVSAESRTAERRKRMIAAGVEVFGSVGYRAATLAAVCAEAGLAKRYFYESFETMEDLLVAVYDHVLADLRQRVAEGVAEASDGLAVVTGALDGLFAWVEDNPRAGRVHLFEVLGVSPRVDAVYRAATREFADLLVLVLQATEPTIALTEGQQKTLGMAIVGSGLQLAQDWVLGEFHPSRAELVEDARGLLVALATGGA
ncbi:TetR/AcrR family transcriptional regulator [Nocardioides baekrokdamisoli]|nr:TetR/AcrR family transcriptional regulator [Nocardioides baekrokdamisoli]